ncbi:MAG TPA: rhodanese-like domain-containing protein [Candidatus Babeliales bacterium]|nr:rhodanese-like domain-containing protein [Candidatus Babeliales bacterium]
MCCFVCRCHHAKNARSIDIKTITAQELKSKLEKDPTLMVINTLSREAYDDCHIKGSTSIPLNDLLTVTRNWDKNKEIIVHCAQYSCPISKQAYKLLIDNGFKNVSAYEGGMREWAQKKFPSEGSCKMEYLK